MQLHKIFLVLMAICCQTFFSRTWLNVNYRPAVGAWQHGIIWGPFFLKKKKKEKDSTAPMWVIVAWMICCMKSRSDNVDDPIDILT